MDAVRRDLYFSLLKKCIKNPPSALSLLNVAHYKAETLFGKVSLASSPLSIVLYVNKVCNFTCSFCYNKDVLRNENDHNEMTRSHLEDILNSHHGRRALRVAFMGGEPFLNKNIFDLIDLASSHKKITNVLTNASLVTESVANELVRSNITTVGISLYSNNEQKVVRLVKKLNESSKSYWVQTVADARSLWSLKERVRTLVEARCRNLIISNYNPYFDKEFGAVVKKGNKEYQSLELELKDMVKNKMNVQWLNFYKEFQVGMKKTCRMPFSYIHVDSSGELGPCCYRYPRPEYGKIGLKTSWNSEAFIRLRKEMLNNNSLPTNECSVCENLYRDLYGI